MKTFIAYANYGVLAAEKRIVWTAEMPAGWAVCSDQHTLEVPEGWKVYENKMGVLCVEAPWGRRYTLNEILTGNEKPGFLAYDKNGKCHRVELKVVD